MSRYAHIQPLDDPRWDIAKAPIYYRGAKPARAVIRELTLAGRPWQYVDAAVQMAIHKQELERFLKERT